MSARSRLEATDRRYYGVAEAIVTAVDDPAREGRVKIQMPWFNEQMETEWCRVRQFYAGNGYGAFFVPEVGDEVLIAFIHGDMRFPIILGGLYNGQDLPPSFRDADKDEKMIRTKAGHQITMDDTSGSEKITIVDKSGKNSIEIDTSGDSITITSTTGKLKLSADSVEIKATAGITIEAGANTDIKGTTINLN
jgi:phage baseplate assembly protein V